MYTMYISYDGRSYATLCSAVAQAIPCHHRVLKVEHGVVVMTYSMHHLIAAGDLLRANGLQVVYTQGRDHAASALS